MFNKKLSLFLILNVLFKVASACVGFYTARWLIGNLVSNDYRIYNLIVPYAQNILFIIALGITQIIQRAYTNEKDENKLADIWTTFNILRIASYLVGVVLILLTFWLSRTDQLGLILLTFTSMFVLLLDGNYRSVANTKGNTWQFSFTDFIGKIALLLGLIFFTYTTNFNGLIYFLVISLVVNCLTLALDMLWQAKYTRLGRFRWSILQENRQAITTLGVSTIAISFYLQTDRPILDYFNKAQLNGYATAYRMYEVSQIVPSMTMPIIASLFKQNLDLQIKSSSLSSNKQALIQPYLFALLLGLSLAVVIYFLAPVALGLIDTERKYYDLAVQILPTLGFSMLFLCPMLLSDQLLVLFHGEKYFLISSLTLAIVGLILYFILIPPFGALGAALATLITYVIDFILKTWFFLKVYKSY